MNDIDKEAQEKYRTAWIEAEYEVAGWWKERTDWQSESYPDIRDR